MYLERKRTMARYVPYQNTRINSALTFATIAHGNQVRKGNEHIPYIFHPVDVANEVIYYSGLRVEDLEKATIVALLHDVVEDTAVTAAQIGEQFGDEVMNGVLALSKNEELGKQEGLSKEKSLRESLARLKDGPLWVQPVKLADRVSNLKSFPAMWSREKIGFYLDEALIIANELGSSSFGLHARLVSRVADARVMLSLIR